ncbi:unnamed protein product [Caenorhabditis bovis]|uniref:G-protein coupled receptors family 1 profile domain-containing protein n=1 Tax=Caenorhabditis bovis TaxID=2654633 RepID=A0A8S1EBN4_9PELO|nr:unnamed protein product [Caenorhabditis bovis]
MAQLSRFQLINQVIVASEIIFFNIFGLFGNVNLILLTYFKPQLRSKSSILQCIQCFSHIICLLFELPNSALLFTGIQLRRPAMMLILVIDLYIMLLNITMYRNVETKKYISFSLVFPIAYSTFIVIYGYVKADDQYVLFCNPPLSMHPDVQSVWLICNVLINFIVLILFIALVLIFRAKGRRANRTSRRLAQRLKLSIIIFVFSWFIAELGGHVFKAIGLQGDLLAFLQSNMVFFVLICYSQSFYSIVWKSSEYRNMFVEMWRCADKFSTTTTTVVSTIHSKL